VFAVVPGYLGVLMADFDRDVAAIAAQPFLLQFSRRCAITSCGLLA
jgi:hypothetical protein